MSHAPAHDDHHDDPPPKRPTHGPHDCYGMPAKRFWRIVWAAAIVTAAIVVSAVLLVARM